MAALTGSEPAAAGVDLFTLLEAVTPIDPP
jgi:hypothetical protein